VENSRAADVQQGLQIEALTVAWMVLEMAVSIAGELQLALWKVEARDIG
jgi:hypothetical protein